MRYDAVIFDLFGTLIDNYSVRDHQRVLAEMAKALGAPEEGFVRLWVDTFNERATGAFPTLEASVEHICRELDVQADAARMAEALGIRLSLTRRTLVPRDDALETLAELRARGLKTGLISDCSEEVPRMWGETPFASAIEAPVFSCVAGVKKPDPRIYRLACEGLEAEPDGCLYVGDGSSRELSGAAAVGMSPVLIRVPYEDSYEPHRIDVDEWDGPEISCLSEVMELV